MKILIKLVAVVLLQISFQRLSAQDAAALVKQVKAKLDKVTDYQATGKMKTNVVFLKVPIATINVYYKKPSKFRITKEKGIAIMPKGGISVNMQSVLTMDNYQAFAVGDSIIGGTPVKMIKLIPADDNSDVVITKLYIDPVAQVIRKARTTTMDNGTYDIEMTYGKYADYALPDKVIFSFNTKDYKLPKGITMEFDDGDKPDKDPLKNKKGKIQIDYQTYIINKGVADSYFK